MDQQPVARVFKARVYISYARADMAFADRLEAGLRFRGFEPLIDRAGIFAFEEWWKRIEALIASADAVVFVISPRAVASSVTLKELEFAERIGKRLLPVEFQRVQQSELPFPLRVLQSIVFDEDFDSKIEQLGEVITRSIDWITIHTQLLQLASEWISHNRSDDYLISGKRLSEAEAWIAPQPLDAPRPSTIHFEFLKASRKAQARRGAYSEGIRPSPQPRGLKIFISYRRSDTRYIAGWIYDRLKTEFPEDQIFFDVGTIPIGVNFRQYIATILEDAAVVLAIVGDNWGNWTWKWSRLLTLFGSSEDFVKSEIDLALDLGVPIIPVVVDTVVMPRTRDLPHSMAEFASLQAAPVRSGRDFDADMRLVLSRIRQWREQAPVGNHQQTG